MTEIEAGEIWEQKISGERIRVKAIDRKIVIGESITYGRQVAITEYTLRAEYKLVESAENQAARGNGK